jgi:hypothetical protein
MDFAKRRYGPDISPRNFADVLSRAIDIGQQNRASMVLFSLEIPTTRFRMTMDTSNLSLDSPGPFLSLITADTIINWQEFTPGEKRQLPARVDFQTPLSGSSFIK